jgi:positive regulator of sigma E activity
MMKRIGTVIGVTGNQARVAFMPEAEVPSEDAAPSECCRPATDSGGEELEATSNLVLHNGDRVEVLVPEPRALGARLVPLLPAVLLPIAGAVVGGLLWGDAGTGIGIGGGLLLGIGVALLVGQRTSGGARGKAEVLRLVHGAAGTGHCRACAADAKGR